MKLTRTLLPQAVAVLVVLVGAWIYVEAQQRLDRIQEDANRRGNFLSSTLSYQLSDPLFLNDIEQVRQNAEFLIGQSKVSEISVFTEDGQFLFDSEQELVPVGDFEKAVIARAARSEGPLFRPTQRGIEFVDAVKFDDQILGGFRFEIDMTDQRTAWRQWVLQATVSSIILLLLGTGLAYLLLRTRVTSRSLEAMTSRFQQLIEQSPLPYATYTPDGRLTYFNPAQRELMNERDSTRRCIEMDYNILEDEILYEEGVLRDFRRGFAGEAVETPPFEYCPADDERPLWLRARIFVSEHGDDSREIVVIYEDVTTEKLAEEERARLNATMLQSQKLEGLGVIARGIAHDLNNFLTPVLGHAELLAMKLGDNQQLGNSAEQIMSGARKAAELCGQMLTQAANSAESRIPTDLSIEVREMNELVRSSISRKIRIETALAVDLPPILVDRSQLRQVILNMLVNASEAMQGGAGDVSLVTGVEQLDAANVRNMLPNPDMKPGPYVYLEVADSGAGMDREASENIFNPFFSTKFTGRGLGMSTVISIVGEHEGGITFETEEGEGTTFRVYFPVLQGEAIYPTENAPSAEPPPKTARRVLFVEDEQSVRETGQMMLESLGYEVTTAENGKQAISRYVEEDRGFDCVVLDYLMPEQDGRETFFQLRRMRRDLPVVIATGLAGSPELRGLEEEEHFRLISKPYRGADLESAISEACSA